MPEMSEASLQYQQLEEREGQSHTRTRISPYGWVLLAHPVSYRLGHC